VRGTPSNMNADICSSFVNEPTAACMDLIERVYVFMVSSRVFDVRFLDGPFSERPHAREFMRDPLLDGWNVVSTAQLLAMRALPRPLTAQTCLWPWAFRRQLCTCLLVAAKWKKGDIISCKSDVQVACCFMTESEKARVYACSYLQKRVNMELCSSQVELVCGPFTFYVAEGLMVEVEARLHERALEMGTRSTFVARNLAVFQVRALVRRAPGFVFNEYLPRALIHNADCWMGKQPVGAGVTPPQVSSLAREIHELVAAKKHTSDLAGPFGDATNHTGKHVCGIF
tara:strand:+ start:3280 stop:4134 length:855 start_codon:yes stop_codon:yes gene_type:complete